MKSAIAILALACCAWGQQFSHYCDADINGTCVEIECAHVCANDPRLEPAHPDLTATIDEYDAWTTNWYDGHWVKLTFWVTGTDGWRKQVTASRYFVVESPINSVSQDRNP